MRDVEYDKTKVEAVYEMARHSLESTAQVEALLARLKTLEQMHLQAPNLLLQIENARSNCEAAVPGALAGEARLLAEARAASARCVAEIEKGM